MVLLGAIDQGTSSSRFLLFEAETGELVTSHQIEVVQHFPQPGWVEMDPMELLNTVVECIGKAVANLQQLGLSPADIKSVGVANQRETTVVWDKRTGKPLHHAIVWLDTRTSELAEQSIERTNSKSKDEFKAKTGLPIHPYFSALKLKWLINNVEAVAEAHKEGNLLFGTVDTWLIWNLSGQHVTDVSNASRTLLLDLHKRKWSSQLCDFFELPMDILPEIRSSAEVYGHFKNGPLSGVPIAGCLGDQQAAMVGHNCLQSGDVKNTYGTGTFMLCNTGTQAVMSKSGLLTTVGYQFGADSPVIYALEGSGSMGGNVIRFLRDNFQFVKDASEVESICSTVSSTEDVYFVPCFNGLFSPYWDSTARGTIVGITQVTTRAHICLAALRAVAFQSAEMLEAVENDLAGTKIGALFVDGGMTANKLFNQIQADVIGKKITAPTFSEISGWGAAVAAGVGAQILSIDEFARREQRATSFEPKSDAATREAELARWRDAVRRSSGWAH